MRQTMFFAFLGLCLALLLVSCGGGQASVAAPVGEGGYGQLDRTRFNVLASRLNLPLFWADDANGNGVVDPAEVRSLRFYPTSEDYVADGAFTEAFGVAYGRMLASDRGPAPTGTREALVRRELDGVAPRLVENDLTVLPAHHRAFAREMVAVAGLIDQIYASQTGADQLADRIPADDVESQSLFRRNWGVRCRGAATEAAEGCSAIAGAPPQPVGVYPAPLQQNEGFCQALENRGDEADDLLDPFVVVRANGDQLVAVPYHRAYEALSGRIASRLRSAAEALQADAEEAALIAYLGAAATAFETNEWEPADEAWAQMNAQNSRWYVRVGPDEVYWDPCSRKAGYHLTLALIDGASLAWQERLSPIQQDMEASLASLNEVYEAREVSFHLPDFIEIVLNAGDDRDPFGATIGQSLPNWGPVRNEGRGRTVAMTNLYAGVDARAARRQRAETLLAESAFAAWTEGTEASLLSTILHEATHNLGPLSGYTYNGQTPAQAFGGGYASMLEELKAQTGALFLMNLLVERGVLTTEQRREAALDDIVWAFGHISRGMYTPSGQRKAYSQLAAIQIGFLLDRGVVTWDPNAPAANGTDRGAFSIDFDAFPAAAEALMTEVMRIKAENDRAGAEALAERYVDGDVVPHAEIQERFRRFPQASFHFSLRL